jgi:hypothetical protein
MPASKHQLAASAYHPTFAQNLRVSIFEKWL